MWIQRSVRQAPMFRYKSDGVSLKKNVNETSIKLHNELLIEISFMHVKNTTLFLKLCQQIIPIKESV